jgi:peptidoglycan/LPS O-acetylase OafA/YrhL
MGFLRFLMAISVITGHAGPLFGQELLDGGSAVQVFFMISGFYMGLILNEKYVWAGSYRTFVSNRFLRIFPIFLVVLVISIAVEYLVFVKGTPLLTKSNFGNTWFAILDGEFLPSGHVGGMVTAFLANLLIFLRGALYLVRLDPAGDVEIISDGLYMKSLAATQFIPQAWSLDLELTFYLLVPLVARLPLGRLAAITAAALGLRLAIQAAVVGWSPAMLSPALYFVLPPQLIFFALGLLAYRVHARFGPSTATSAMAGRMAAMLIIPITLFFSEIPMAPGIKVKIYYLMVLVALPFLFEATRNSTVDRWIGELSYPIYICHVLVLTLMLAFWEMNLSSPLAGPVCAAFSILLSVALNLAVANPVERLRRKQVERARTGGSAPISLVKSKSSG